LVIHKIRNYSPSLISTYNPWQLVNWLSTIMILYIFIQQQSKCTTFSYAWTDGCYIYTCI